MTKQEIIVTIDPNTRETGIALMVGGVLKGYDVIKADNVAAMILAIKTHEFFAIAPHVLATEGVYLATVDEESETKRKKKGEPLNAAMVLDLARIDGALMSFAQDMLAEFYSMPVCVPKKDEPKYTTIDYLCELHYQKGGRKAATKAFAMKVFGVPGDLEEHVYDALCVLEAATVYREQIVPQIEREKRALSEQWGE